ncbi:uncharacterized protein ACLA_086340 [Aspergillus clavatus NRRL 1]|uniref:Leucine rich repeat protein n=1 Tax=Aspergillus clavatus (strain ATCC 1007 / CBS 513.65 / DSM 816 / NCTC 3887 / NRRL 1 / QM 1276 / 107) TaxID=344612 RepID=A1CUE8_ASPCL|nr:leucine rich repeat protein [Aspergillus clavatus NRRL 1]EAW06935.1 leucine rich repeat protein [Aspergillus clavatus NRRL 1]
MGKLNYSARKITSLKAGQVVSKDLKKRIPPGAGAKAAVRDPVVEIDISNKDLADEGFAEFIDDLIACIKYRDEEHLEGSAKVTELHLQGNQLTVLSLRKLSEVVKSSAADLRELDISHNKFEIRTPQEQEIWHDFLASFKDCFMLKKLDLGNNPLGAKGIEILARVYMHSDLDYLEADADAIIGLDGDNAQEEETIEQDLANLQITNGKENEPPKKTAAKQSPKRGKVVQQNGSSHASSAAKKPSHDELKYYACTRGLRSIPFLILSNTNLTGSCAVHLSSMLSMHRTPEQLLAFLPSGKGPSLPGTAQQCKGIIWLPNEGLGPNECKFLDKAEMVGELMSNDGTGIDELSEEDDHRAAQRKMQKKLDIEYARLGKRVCMNAMKNEGVRDSDLWRTALKMMVVSRAILLDDYDRANEAAPEEEESPPSAEETVEEEKVEDVKVEEEPAEPSPEEVLDEFPLFEPYPIGPFHPGAQHFEVNFPSLQPAIKNKGPESQGTKSPETQEIKSSESPSQAPRSGKGRGHSNSVTRSSHKGGWRFGVPFAFWRRIIADAVGADDILSIQQQIRVMIYAADWDALAYEMTIRGAEEHQQIWKFLETVKCINYSSLS